MIKPTNENLPEPNDWDEFEDGDNDLPDGYECACCGHVQDDNGWGGECDKCGAKALDEFYF